MVSRRGELLTGSSQTGSDQPWPSDQSHARAQTTTEFPQESAQTSITTKINTFKLQTDL